MGLPVYTIQPKCHEDASASIDSGQTWVALNASAWEKAPEGSLREVLQYTQSGHVPDGSTEGVAAKIDRAVSRANGEAAWKEEAMGVMTLEHHWQARCEAAWEGGETRGLVEGEAKFAKLADALFDSNRLDDLKRAVADEAFRSSLFEELGI